MTSNIQITELHLISGFDNKLKITGASAEEEAKAVAEKWCDENNSLYKSITFSKEANYYIVEVTTDDYN